MRYKTKFIKREKSIIKSCPIRENKPLCLHFNGMSRACVADPAFHPKDDNNNSRLSLFLSLSRSLYPIYLSKSMFFLNILFS